MSTTRQYTLLGSDELSQLSSGFIRFVEELLLPITKQDNKQFQAWTKFKEIIDPFSKKIELAKVEQFLLQSSKSNQENRPPLPLGQIKRENSNFSASTEKVFTPTQPTQQAQPFPLAQPSFPLADKHHQMKQILDKISKQFHQNNTHLDILLKMNDSSSQHKTKYDSGTKPTTNNSLSGRRVEYKRRNTDFYSFRTPIPTFQA